MSDQAGYEPLRAVSGAVHLLGVSILSHCLSHRVPPLNSWVQWKNLTWGRACMILVLFDSWLFVFFSGVLANGVGLTLAPLPCTLAIYACITFYGVSKFFIYAFLSEKVYIVWSGGNQTPRFRTLVYKICAFVLMLYIAVTVLVITGRQSAIRDDGVCIIGLKKTATLSLIAYDLFLNVFLTAMFLWPLWRSHIISPPLRHVAKRTLYGACASLILSASNIAILTAVGGNENGYICLSACVTDVTLNALVLFWVSSSSYPSRGHDVPRDRFSLPTLDVSILTVVPDAGVSVSPPGEPIVSPPISTRSQGPCHGQSLPEEYFDYIPREHRGSGSCENEKMKEVEKESPCKVGLPAVSV
ncbi:hypothetical protein K435DRAFT_753241 [Dendrothele bispora CBS 962.96]|uniref:Transmembrane protein n=1 Tax=Dendrothele bispora (strain CBS 962.96) TaxID=1314807 RepID=A0A4S8M755_DENBC|nr:hypothetical protein K435DRAFT_753241 [Dendrothele bispora CBS 962.96]